jgi:hypothetical protein
MATKAIAVQAATPQDLASMKLAYIAKGFSVMTDTPAQVALFKKKPFPTVWIIVDVVLIFLFGFGVLLIILHLIMYAVASDQMVTITVANMAAPAYSGQLSQPGSGQLSQPVSGQIGAASDAWQSAPRSPDGNYWWDGQAWQPVPQAGQSGPMPQAPTGPMGY